MEQPTTFEYLPKEGEKGMVVSVHVIEPDGVRVVEKYAVVKDIQKLITMPPMVT